MFLDQIKMKFKKPKTVLSLKVDADKCVGCGSCASGCKRNVFRMDGVTRKAEVNLLERCVGCGKCVNKMCKLDAISLVVAEQM